jgi:hypothetical protein
LQGVDKKFMVGSFGIFGSTPCVEDGFVPPSSRPLFCGRDKREGAGCGFFNSLLGAVAEDETNVV